MWKLALLCFVMIATAQVVELGMKNWNLVENSDLYMVAFTAPWCGHCKSLKPAYQQAAESLGGIVPMGNVNCDDEKELPGRFGVQGFPTIKIFSKGKVIDDYQGGRTAHAIVDALMSRFNALPDQVKVFKTKEEIEGSAKPLTLLFTNKKTIPALFKSLSFDFKKLAFGVVFDETLTSEYSIEKPPKIIVLHDETELTRYEGELKKVKIAEFLKGFTEKKAEPPKPKPVNVEKLSETNFLSTCENLCVLGCARDKTTILDFAKKYEKDKLKFLWVDVDTQKSVCEMFGVTGETSTDLVVLRVKRMKFAVHKDASVANTERFFESVLFGGIKFETLESLPSIGKDEL